MTKDPRPLKKAKRTPTDKEMVDIWGSDFEEELVPTEDTAGPSGTTQRLVTISPANNSADDNHLTAIKSRMTSSPPSFTTSVQKGRREQSSYLPCIFAMGYNKLPSLNMGDENLTEAEWMLDSGASEHFTGDINDFVEFETLAPIAVQTTTETTNIIGRGSVILQIKNKVLRIYPVYYIPELTTQLFSLGQFLQAGLLLSGNARQISVHEGEEEFLSFYPRHKKGTIYVVQSLLGKKVDARIETIHMVDFEIMHRRLVHPSNDVMRQARKYVKDFPKVEIPTEHFCPGCAQGKMPNKAFPPTETRATEPFELIHSDLKSFPIDSYHKFQYAIIFFDDYSSHAWTINLKMKDAALHATKHFLAMVETQYKTVVRGWMSDAGGEFKSKAFISMLTERGIKILQSILHAHQQNGRAERIIRTLMEKAESMRLRACLPQSWWEFALDHATHIYNRTPIRCLSWCTPSEWLSGN